MDINKIKNIFSNYIPKPIGVENCFSVLISLVEKDETLHILYELRSKNLERQPGEISFPGGKIERNETQKEAAIRECCEELNLKPENIDLIGAADYLLTPFNYLIYSYVGFLKVDVNKIKPNEEVEKIFTIPLDYFLNHDPLKHDTYLTNETDEGFPYELIPNGKNYNWRIGKYPVYFYIYEDYIIWGLTARLTYEFIQKLKLTT
ncbi:CoA pyrophosphatase [Petrotoga sp. 9PWA.NaAc.5.4]|uniref:NUDIX hydrolase n=1 Tax=Petrotoga sp. 9PWA.NaAc.5.4 TaxID=1434328 RepID=UPI000CB32694|nr:CoA pyrophosphatase [Petrotoga sp. 9PWA.NaAc.5.4]PNR96202.1 NUDIX hydrolase [Petrotoga sp. 9PWA.NaAc.5.4]